MQRIKKGKGARSGLIDLGAGRGTYLRHNVVLCKGGCYDVELQDAGLPRSVASNTTLGVEHVERRVWISTSPHTCDVFGICHLGMKRCCWHYIHWSAKGADLCCSNKRLGCYLFTGLQLGTRDKM